MTFIRRAACLVLAFACGRVAAFPPYAADEHTLHLWHLDETGPPFADSGRSPKPLLGLINGARAGSVSLPGLGRSVSFDDPARGEPHTPSPEGALLLARPFSANGPEDDVTPPFPIMGKDGAFTIEALVKFERLPAEAPGIAYDVVSMDGDGDKRVFTFRIDKPGFVNFIPFSGHNVRGGGLATIPTSGPHAINTRDWFHLAVTYDGKQGQPGNLILYWTRVTPGLKAANPVGRGMLNADLGRELGDFAIGNTGRSVVGRKAGNPFPGLIDEVRISSIARNSRDFFFVPEDARKPPAGESSGPDLTAGPLRLGMQQVLVDGRPAGRPGMEVPLVIGPGLHRLDFDFAPLPGTITPALEIRCRLEGIEDTWHPAERGMWIICEVLGSDRAVVSRTAFASIGQSAGWSSDPYESKLTPRIEPLFLPGDAKALRITLSSGTADTTGQLAVDDIAVELPSPDGKPVAAWRNGAIEEGERMDTVGGVPDGWERGAEDPAIAPVVLRAGSRALGLLDGSQTTAGLWTSEQALPPLPPGGTAALLRWKEAHSVIGGGSHRATYLNVPPGDYRFRAVAVTPGPPAKGSHLEFPVEIRRSPWENPWVRPAAASVAVALAALVLLQTYRRRALARLSELRLQHTVERDRARIARDLHDDLGTRVSSLMMGVSLVRRDLDGDPDRSRRQLDRMGTAARELVTAMNGLVWAVDPANDTLEQLASHLQAMAQEMFQDSDIRLRIEVPTRLPSFTLGSDFRHHFSMALKETLHNVLKHAGPCEAFFELRLEENELVAAIRDTGRGFNAAHPREGNGLLNLQSRLAELKGSCQVETAPGGGTRVTLRCPLQAAEPRHPR